MSVTASASPVHAGSSSDAADRSAQRYRFPSMPGILRSFDTLQGMSDPDGGGVAESGMRESIDGVVAALTERAYLADRGLATVVHLALALGKPLLLEGEAGVGKTELAKALADVLGARLIRLQCYEGIDVAHALYDWSYARQMLCIRTAREGDVAPAGDSRTHAARAVRAASSWCAGRCSTRSSNDDPVPPVLLIDEIDRADDEFEAFLLELLSDFQVTIPEIGTIRGERAARS